MKVLLLKDVKTVGIRGMVLEVSDGHAINFLLPQKLAVPVTESVLQQLEKKKVKKVVKQQKQQKEQNKVIQKLKDRKYQIKVRANEQGRLFKGVSPEDIRKSILDDGITLPENAKIVITKPIKQVGEHEAEVVFSGNVITKIHLKVI